MKVLQYNNGNKKAAENANEIQKMCIYINQACHANPDLKDIYEYDLAVGHPA